MNEPTPPNRRGAAVSALLAALALAGCAGLAPATTPTAPPAPAAQWQAPLPASDPAAELKRWWQQFNDPLLA